MSQNHKMSHQMSHKMCHIWKTCLCHIYSGLCHIVLGCVTLFVTGKKNVTQARINVTQASPPKKRPLQSGLCISQRTLDEHLPVSHLFETSSIHGDMALRKSRLPEGQIIAPKKWGSTRATTQARGRPPSAVDLLKDWVHA